MKSGMRAVVAGVVAMAFTGIVACKGKAPGVTKMEVVPPTPVITAVWGTTVTKKPAVKALAKTNGPNQVAFYLYSFPAEETYPDGAAYKDDDFFIEAALNAGDGKTVAPGTYTGDQLTSLVIHTKTINVIVGNPKSSIVITTVGNGKIKGEFKLDDGSAKVSGPFEMDLL